MGWQDCGIIFTVNNLYDWAISHCYVPTALNLNDRIRIYAAFFDNNKHGRLGYIDLDANVPTKVLGISTYPIIKDANGNAFDSHGVTPLSITLSANQIRLYYAGWKRFELENKRYTIFTGLAISDNGDTFQRYSDECILGPRNENDQVNTGGVVLPVENGWRMWLASHNRMLNINGKQLPAYDLCTTFSDDGVTWNNCTKKVFEVVDHAIMGYGRSAIWRENGMFHGLFSVRGWDSKYKDLFYSTSTDGIKWQPLSLKGMAFRASQTIDAQNEVCFPSIIQQESRTLMFYNGNDFGREGLRLAIWTP